jgi:hypothetical protein
MESPTHNECPGKLTEETFNSVVDFLTENVPTDDKRADDIALDYVLHDRISPEASRLLAELLCQHFSLKPSHITSNAKQIIHAYVECSGYSISRRQFKRVFDSIYPREGEEAGNENEADL